MSPLPLPFSPAKKTLPLIPQALHHASNAETARRSVTHLCSAEENPSLPLPPPLRIAPSPAPLPLNTPPPVNINLSLKHLSLKPAVLQEDSPNLASHSPAQESIPPEVLQFCLPFPPSVRIGLLNYKESVFVRGMGFLCGLPTHPPSSSSFKIDCPLPLPLLNNSDEPSTLPFSPRHPRPPSPLLLQLRLTFHSLPQLSSCVLASLLLFDTARYLRFTLPPKLLFDYFEP